jgi:hypothetical protein
VPWLASKTALVDVADALSSRFNLAGASSLLVNVADASPLQFELADVLCLLYSTTFYAVLNQSFFLSFVGLSEVALKVQKNLDQE